MRARDNVLTGMWLIISFIGLRTLNQILFKHVALGPGGSSYPQLFLEPLFYLAGVIFFGQAVVWILILKRLPLSVAYPFTSLTIISLLVSGILFFGESLTMGNVLGAIIIMSGIVVISGEKGMHDRGKTGT